MSNTYYFSNATMAARTHLHVKIYIASLVFYQRQSILQGGGNCHQFCSVTIFRPSIKTTFPKYQYASLSQFLKSEWIQQQAFYKSRSTQIDSKCDERVLETVTGPDYSGKDEGLEVTKQMHLFFTPLIPTKLAQATA